MKLARILRDLINKLFGKDESKQISAPQPVTEVRNAEGSCNSGSSTKSTVTIMIEAPEEEETLSREEVMKMIKAMIKTEDKQKPLYDTEILAALQKEGVDLTVRTICRYRNDMDIDSRKERLEDYRDEAEKRRKKRRKKDSCD